MEPMKGPLQCLQEFPTLLSSEALNPPVKDGDHIIRPNAGTTSSQYQVISRKVKLHPGQRPQKTKNNNFKVVYVY
jgi:hypothetical protein